MCDDYNYIVLLGDLIYIKKFTLFKIKYKNLAHP